MSKVLKEVHGTIFRRQRYREADVLAKVLSKEMGIFTILIRGALRPKSKLGTETLNFSTGGFVVLTDEHGISPLRTIKEVRQFENIFYDLTENAYASFIFDLVDHAFEEYHSVGEYYDLVELALKKINDGDNPEIITQLVQLHLLKAYGVQPELRHCVICGKERGIFDYSIKLGGVLCSDHFSTISSRMHLQPKETALIRTLGLMKLNQLGAIKVSEQTQEATRKAIDRIYNETVDLDLKSKRFLDEIRSVSKK